MNRTETTHRRFSPLSLANVRLEQRADADAAPVIAGYGSVFYDGTPETEYQLYRYFKERIMPGAFDRAIAEGHDVRGLFNHDANFVLGRTKSETLRLSIDQRGLKYEIDPNAEDTDAMNVVARLRRGDVTGSSFSFRIVREEYLYEDDVTIALVKDVDLYDVGPVTFPAYEAADSSVRSADVEARIAAAKEALGRGKRTPRSLVLATARAIELRRGARG